MPDTSLPIKIGSVVERQKACPACGSVAFKVEPGKGPHAFHLRCQGCGRGGYWIGKKEAGLVSGSEAA